MLDRQVPKAQKLVVMRTNYKIINPDNPYFITSTIMNWIQIFNSESYYDLLFQNLVFYQSKYEMEIIAYVLMPEHFHLISKAKALGKAIQAFKSYTAKKIIEKLYIDKNYPVLDELRKLKLKYKIDSEFQIWQEGAHPQEIQNNLILKQKTEYIHNNPVKRGLVDNQEDWEYSSARFYLMGTKSDLIITPYC